MYDNLRIILVNTVEELAARVKSYVDLEISKEWRNVPKESKNEIQKGKRIEQHTSKASHDHRWPFLAHPNRDVYDTSFTPEQRRFRRANINGKKILGDATEPQEEWCAYG